MSKKNNTTNGNVNPKQEEVMKKKNMKELKQIAKELGVKSYYKLRKNELIEAIKEYSLKVVDDDELTPIQEKIEMKDIETLEERLRKEAAAFKDRKAAFRPHAEAEKLFSKEPAKAEIILSKGKNPVVENGLKVFVYGLTPETIDVKGIVVVPKWGDGKVIGVTYKEGPVTIAKTSPFAEWAVSGKIQVLTIDSNEHEVKFHCYEYAQKDAWRHGNKLIYGNLKKTECVMGVATPEVWNELTGHNVALESNPNKFIGTFMTPHNYAFDHSINGDTIKLLIIDKQKTRHGYPLNDGNMVCAFSLFYERVHAVRERMEALEKAKADAELAGLEFDESKFKYDRKWKRANASFQFRTDPKYKWKDKPLPSFKGKAYSHWDKFMRLANKHGFQPYELKNGKLHWNFNAIATLDLPKTRQSELKHGDIIEFPAKALRIVAIKVSDGKSALGRQSVALHGPSVRQLLREHAVENAKVVKRALKGDPEAFLKVLMADTEASFEDAALMPVKVFGFMPEPNRIPLYGPIANVVLARIYAYVMEHVFKARIFDYAAYLEVNEELDEMEIKHFEEHGTWVNYFLAPHCNKFLKANKEGVNWNIGRNPIVGPGNVMGFKFAGFNNTTDTIEVSARALYTMFGDVDGDTCIVFPHKEVSFPVITRPAPKPSDKKKEKVEIDRHKLADVAIDAALQVIQSARDTGILDNRRRQIIHERWAAGNPCTVEEIMEMGNITEDAISGMKHSEAGAEEGAEGLIIRKFGVNGRSNNVRKAPREYKATRKDGGNSSVAGIQRECMLSLVKVWKDIVPTSFNPYNEVLNELNGASFEFHHKDAAWMRSQLIKFWRTNIAKYHAKGFYPWTEGEVIHWAKALVYGDNSANIIGYGNEAREISKRYGNIKKIRREKYSALNNKYQDHIRKITGAVLKKYAHRISGDKSKWALRFMRQLMIQVGILGFRTGTKMGPDGNPGGLYSTGGSCFWTFPLEQGLLWLAKAMFPENPYIGKIEAAVEENARRRMEYELLMKQAEVDSFSDEAQEDEEH